MKKLLIALLLIAVLFIGGCVGGNQNYEALYMDAVCRVIETKDSSYCDKLAVQGYKNECYVFAAVVNNDSSICNKLDTNGREYCILSSEEIINDETRSGKVNVNWCVDGRYKTQYNKLEKGAFSVQNFSWHPHTSTYEYKAEDCESWKRDSPPLAHFQFYRENHLRSPIYCTIFDGETPIGYQSFPFVNTRGGPKLSYPPSSSASTSRLNPFEDHQIKICCSDSEEKAKNNNFDVCEGPYILEAFCT